MNNHSINLDIRFLLEVIAIVAFGNWRWQNCGSVKYLLVIALPVIVMMIWALFRMPNDRGHLSLAVIGVVRVVIESLFIGAAVPALFSLGYRTFSKIFFSSMFITFYDRII